MRNSKISLSFVLATALTIGSYIPALAEVGVNTSVDASVNVNASVRASSSANSRSGDESTTSDNRSASSSNKVESHATTTGSETAAENRSVVATFVQHLLSIANREGGIGSEVRVIAQEQSSSSSTTADAIAKVESRGGFIAFLFGTDYKNTGVIRSELAQTAKRIERLSEIASSTSISAQARVELRAQIQSLTDEQVKLDAFVNAHENQFSLFGWFVKLFNK
jgi:hypothetical protein